MSNSWFSFSLSGIFIPALTIVAISSVIGVSCYILKKAYGLKGTFEQSKMRKNNIISIIHSTANLNLTLSDTTITINTHMNFIKEYEKMNKDEDIHIIMHTTGGALSSAEAICNCILNHQQGNYKGKIIAHIPYYAYSGGCMIAIACDKIIMSTNAILGPCDGQKLITGVHSISSIINTVKHKTEKGEKTSEIWIAASLDAELCIKRQAKYVDKLVKSGKFSEDIGAKIYQEFFSGQYNHDQTFNAEEALSLGLNIEIVNAMPPRIANITNNIGN